MARRSSGNFSLARGAALADITQQQAKEQSEARRAEAEAKAQHAEAWNNQANQLKQLAQGVLDGTSTGKDYSDAISQAASQFPDKAGLLQSNLRSVIRGADTSRFNDYVSGAMTFDDFKAYANDRQKEGSGDLDHLSQLLSKAQKNEDTVQYNSYIKGETSIGDWNKYVAGRTGDPKSPTTIHLATLDAQAQANESRANDRRYQTAYQAGVLPGDQYQKYLDGRIGQATNPNDLNALRIEKQTVEKNEFVKQVNTILDGAQSGRLDAGSAALQLHSLLGQTNDAALQTQVLNHIATLQKQVGAAAASVAAALRQKQTEVNSNYAAAQTEFNSAMTKVNTLAGKGGDPATALAQAARAWNNFALEIDNAAKNSTDQTRAAFFQDRLQHLDTERSASMSTILQDAAQAKGELTGKNTNPISGAASRAEILLRGLANPYLTSSDKQGIYKQAQQVISDAKKQWSESQEGRNAESFIQNRAVDVMGGGSGVQKALQDGATKAGLGPIDFKNQDSVAAALRELTMADPTGVWKTLSDNGVKGFNVGSTDEFNTADKFTSTWNAFTGGAVGLRDITQVIHGNKDAAGLSLGDRAFAEAFVPDSLGWMERNTTPESKAHMLATDTTDTQQATADNSGTHQNIYERNIERPQPTGTSPGVAGQENIGNVPKAPPLYGKFPGQEGKPAEMSVPQAPVPQADSTQPRDAESQIVRAHEMNFDLPITPAVSMQDISATGIQQPIEPQTTPTVPIRDITSPSQIDPGSMTTNPSTSDQDVTGGGGGGGRRM